MDYITDKAIHDLWETEFTDRTILTIAHRLHNIVSKGTGANSITRFIIDTHLL